MTDEFPAGMVWLVGAGPGDPDLLTRKAERLIRAADVIFFDALVTDDVLALASEGTRLVSVGKRAGRHSKAQGTINDLLLAAARQGHRVVRLKGGDPSVFGRSAEEIEHLASGGAAARICPGITTASAAAASAGTSLTLRGSARGITFVTAHARAGEALQLDWPALGSGQQTLGIYMGRAAAPEIARELIAAGLPKATPVMVAVNVSRRDERLIRGELGSLAFLVATISDDDPTLLLIGEVASVRHLAATSRTAMDKVTQ